MADTNTILPPQQGASLDLGDDAIEKATETPRRRGRPSTRSQSDASARGLPRGQYQGRNGEVLTRKVSLGNDPYEIPAHLKEAGWDYQWLTETVLNSPDVVRRHTHAMFQAGWRPVLAVGRWNGIFDAPNYTGHVRLGDSALYERPMEMSVDAKIEDEKRARQQVRDRDNSLMGHKANLRGSLPDGFAMGGKYRGTGGDLRMSIDPALDAPAPSHQSADDSIP